MDAISKARALIAPLKDFTPGPWQVDAPEDKSVEIAARIFAIAGLYETAPEALPDARLIAAAPALRDTVAALADLADAQAQENANLTAENADLKTSVVAFCGVHAVTYAKQFGLPDGHLHPTHYDILEKAGARMDGFTRAALGETP